VSGSGAQSAVPAGTFYELGGHIGMHVGSDRFHLGTKCLSIMAA
jgi:hypothetical protein